MGNKEQQFQALVHAYSARLYRYAYWLCGNPALAEDLVQETFARAWKSLGSLKEESAAKSWLMTILHRENARRFERVQPVIVDVEYADLEAGKGHGPEHDMERRLLHRAILNLKPEYREPLIMQVIGGFSYKEIGNALGLDKGVLVMRLYRAKRKLSEILTDTHDFGAESKHDGRS
ncbi:MAG: sigma-70 family RNA polymerase sigma factor [Gammaproteobacteria bacterium]|nr:sigma-70 family RNA polymerase sigma factor [Gammaproteobacteria bacterium]